ncbi:MAG: BatD family protein [Aggregatilineales bacterium]
MLRWLLIIAVFFPALLLSQAQETENTPAYFVEAAVSSSDVFIGQQVTYSFRLYTSAVMPQAEYVPPDFEGFWRSEMGPVTSTVESVGGTFYTVTQLDTALFPLTTGNLIIAPALLVFPETVFRAAEVLESNVAAVRARPLPSGAPENFTGVVGALEVEAAFAQREVRAGEPVTLRVTVRGNGNIEQMPPPHLSLPTGWQAYNSRTAYRAEVVSEQLIGEKTFEWLVVVTQSETQTLPPIELAYFDPDMAAYRVVSTAPLTLVIVPREVAADDTPLAATTAAPTSGQLVTLRPISSVFAVSDPAGPPWPLWAAPAAAAAAVWLWRQRKRRNLNRGYQAKQALARAQRRLKVLPSANPDLTGLEITLIVQSYVADKLNQPGSVNTLSAVKEALRRHNVGAETTGQLQNCLDLADQVRFAPRSDVNLPQLIQRTSVVLGQVDAQWQD